MDIETQRILHYWLIDRRMRVSFFPKQHILKSFKNKRFLNACVLPDFILVALLEIKSKF